MLPGRPFQLYAPADRADGAGTGSDPVTPEHAPIDEEQLAALLSGRLSEPERSYVLARLAADPEARTVLQMALEALEAAESDNDRRAA